VSESVLKIRLAGLNSGLPRNVPLNAPEKLAGRSDSA
jgi:hypothetical protein